MKTQYSLSILLTAVMLLLIACAGKPKVVEQVNAPQEGAQTVVTDNFNVDPATQTHNVLVEETLEATKYTYARVKENGENYWIAVPKQEIEVGATYLFKGGLLKRNFKSQEHDRTFETIFLVTQVAKAPAGGDGSALDRAAAQLNAGNDSPQAAVEHGANTITLKQLFENKDQYDGKTVAIKGRCVKMNKNIMGINWVHIQDGCDPDKELDLTVTTQADIPVGALVEIEGTIVLNKDFGSGYFYDIIMENGHTH